jgi:cell division protein FtsB
MTILSSPPPIRPWWKTLVAVVAGILAFVSGAGSVFTFDEKLRIEPIRQQVELHKDKATELERKNKEAIDENTQLRAEIDSLKQGFKDQDSQSNLALFSGYESLYTFDQYTRNVAVGLILSDQTRNALAQTPPEKINAVIIFAPDQESVILWIRDARGNSENRTLFRNEGQALNPERDDERYFELLISNFQSVDPSSISKIVFETRNIPSTAQRFLVKSIDLK